MSVLTVITRRAGALTLARLGYRVARAREEKLVVFCVDEASSAPHPENDEPATITPGDEIPEGASATVALICRELERGPHAVELREGNEASEVESEKAECVLPDPEVEVRWLATSHGLQVVLEQVKDVGATYLIAAQHKSRSRDEHVSPSGETVPLARQLFTAAPCHTLLTRVGETEEGGAGTPPTRSVSEDSPGARLPGAGQMNEQVARLRRDILVPTAGGPHAEVALRLGERLARAEGGCVVALHVVADAGEFASEVGERILKRAIAAAGLADSRCVEPRVELGDDRVGAIARIASEGFDLVLLGESNAGSVRRRLFGTVPEHLLGDDGLQVAVVRREWKLFHRLRQRLGRWLDLTIPQMARAERITLYEKLQSGSEWNFDFMTLISLSTAIAALGLLQDSAAVVIGAMLVAPLMTPILGAGLALVQGNFPLLKIAGRAIVSGYVMALLIGLTSGLVFPIPELTPQLSARGGPTLLDLGVAFLSGIAAAFCLSRPGLLAALPGVAIAAALVPPIATTGVCLALGELSPARGSALLFLTNVVAIILGAAVSLYASGVRGKRGAGSHQKWVSYAFLVLLLGTVALAFPLGSGLRSQLKGGAGFEIPKMLEDRLEQRLGEHSEIRLESRREDGERILVIKLAAPQPPSAEVIGALADVARTEVGEDLIVRVETRLRAEVR